MSDSLSRTLTEAAPVIGHVVIDCTRCGQPRHVPVTCRAVPVAGPGAYTWKVTRGGEQVGEMHLDFQAQPDGHHCPTGDSAPVGALRLVREAS